MKQLATSNLEFQQNMNSIPTKHERHHPRPQDANRTANQHYEPFTIDWIMSAHLVPYLNQVGLSDPKPTNDTSSSPPPPTELKPLLSHLKQHKKAIGWKLFDLPGINPSICMHRILMEEEAHLIRQQQRRVNPTILDVVKKEVMKLLAAGIIYPISDSQC
ncbi:hypothetical protein CR513_53469, partial [Mucuna pruriens]